MIRKNERENGEKRERKRKKRKRKPSKKKKQIFQLVFELFHLQIPNELTTELFFCFF